MQQDNDPFCKIKIKCLPRLLPCYNVRVDDSDNEASLYRRKSQLHYYGDVTRTLFIVGAVLLLVAITTGAVLPLSSFGTVIAAIVLVVAGGITNHEQHWIHWVNESIAIFGVYIFGVSAINNYRAGVSISNPSYLYTELIAVMSLIALYYATKTIRGILLRSIPSNADK